MRPGITDALDRRHRQRQTALALIRAVDAIGPVLADLPVGDYAPLLALSAALNDAKKEWGTA